MNYVGAIRALAPTRCLANPLEIQNKPLIPHFQSNAQTIEQITDSLVQMAKQ